MHTRSYILAALAISFSPCLHAQNAPPQKASTGFVENKGQMHDGHGDAVPSVKYLLALPGMNVQLRTGGFSYDTYTREGTAPLPEPRRLSYEPSSSPDTTTTLRFHRIDVEFAGARKEVRLQPEAQGSDYLNYYTAAVPGGATGVRHFGKVTYKGVWPHIDVEFLARPGTGKPIEYNFILHPGAKISDIQLRYRGADSSALTDGKPRFHVRQGVLSESIPRSYWQGSGEAVDVRYYVQVQDEEEDGALTVGFATPRPFSCRLPLVIDPVPDLEWSTYYGGPGQETGNAVCMNKGKSAVYFGGWSNSFSAIATTGAYQTVLPGYNGAAFLAKFDTAGTRLWATYYGGTNSAFASDGIHALAPDTAGGVFAAGYVTSDSGIATPGAHKTALTGYSDGFLIRFSAAGARLWGTYYGGSGSDGCGALHSTPDGYVLAGGSTASDTGIATPGAHSATLASTTGDAWLAKFSSTGTRIWGTYFGGDQDDGISDIGSDSAGNVYIAGSTSSTTGIATTGAYSTAYGGSWEDAFAAKFSPAGARLWGTYFGGSDAEDFRAIKVDGAGTVWFGGNAYGFIPTTPGAHQSSMAGGASDACLVQFSATGALLYSTYYGGPGNDYTWGLAAGDSGSVYIAGGTFSTSGISTSSAYSPVLLGFSNGFVSRFSASGAQDWGTYYGGTVSDPIYSLASDDHRNLYVTGVTTSPGQGTPSAHQTALASTTGDAFLARLNACTPAYFEGVLSIAALDDSVCAGEALTLTASTSAGTGAFSGYRWYRNGILIPGATGPTYTTSAPVSGDVYRCEIFTANPCAFPGALLSNTVTVAVFPLPIPVITRAGSTFSTTTFSSYQWLRNGAVLPGATSKNYTSSTTGLYRVIVTDANGCSDTSAPYYFNLAVGDAPAVASQTFVFPNPATTELFLQSPVQLDAVLATLDGRTVLREENASSLDLRALPGGLYLLRLYNHRDGALIKTEKVVKQR